MTGFDWDAGLTEEERDTLIAQLAERVARHNMATPAILMLEMHKPVAFLAGQSLLVGSGFLAPLFGPQNVRKYIRLLESRENIELLIRSIETTQCGSIGKGAEEIR